MNGILEKLKGGDRRSIGRVPEVVEETLRTPMLFRPLFEGMLDDDPIVRMRCADAVEKITAKRPDYLQPFKERLIHRVAIIDQQEVRWHVAQMFPRLKATSAEQALMVEILHEYLRDRSRIVKACAMEALVAFAESDAALQSPVRTLLEDLARTGSPAIRARGRKLLSRLGGKS
jgi:hypothetical protein